MKKMENGLFHFCEQLMHFAFLNILWLLFSLPIITIIPSTFAMFCVLKEWENITDDSTAHNFWKAFKSNFFKSYKVLGPSFAICVVLVIDTYIFYNITNEFSNILYYSFLILSFLFLMITFYSVPIYLRYQLSIIQTFVLAFVVIVKQPIVTLGAIVGIGAVIAGSLFMPGLGILLFGSLSAWLINLTANIGFQKLETNQA